MSHLGEIGALGRPHGSSTKTKDEGGWKECVELGVELGRDVGGVAEDAHHQGPLHLQLLDQDARHEAAREDEAGVDGGVRPCPQVVHLHRFVENFKYLGGKAELTELMEDCSLDMDSKPIKSARKLTDISRTFL